MPIPATLLFGWSRSFTASSLACFKSYVTAAFSAFMSSPPDVVPWFPSRYGPGAGFRISVQRVVPVPRQVRIAVLADQAPEPGHSQGAERQTLGLRLDHSIRQLPCIQDPAGLERSRLQPQFHAAQQTDALVEVFLGVGRLMVVIFGGE